MVGTLGEFGACEVATVRSRNMYVTGTFFKLIQIEAPTDLLFSAALRGIAQPP